MNNMLVSIIIPVYNGASTILRCLESIIPQMRDYVEIIVVNDGSNDGTAVVLSSLSCVHVINQINKGANCARITGAKHARGKWLLFLDADDTLQLDAINMIMPQLSDTKDIICNSFRSIQMCGEQYAKSILSGEIDSALSGKLFRRSLFVNHAPQLDREIIVGEDLITNVIVGLSSGTVQLACIPFYNYNTQNIESIMHVFKHSISYEKFYYSSFESALGMIGQSGFWCDCLPQIMRLKLNGLRSIIVDGNIISYNDAYFKDIAFFYSGSNKLTIGDWTLLHVKSNIIVRLIFEISSILRRTHGN